MLQDIRDINCHPPPFFSENAEYPSSLQIHFCLHWIIIACTNIISDCIKQWSSLKLHEDPVYSKVKTFENPYTGSILFAQLPADFDQHPEVFCSLSAGVIYKVHQAKNSK